MYWKPIDFIGNICREVCKAGEGTEQTPAEAHQVLHKGHSGWHCSHWLRHAAWKACPQRWIVRTNSPTPISSRQITQRSSPCEAVHCRRCGTEHRSGCSTMHRRNDCRAVLGINKQTPDIHKGIGGGAYNNRPPPTTNPLGVTSFLTPTSF